jgi:hypothetical protein
MNFVTSIIDAVTYAAIAAEQRFANHSEAIPGEPKWISIISIKPTFAIAITLQYSIDQTLQFVGYIFWDSHNFNIYMLYNIGFYYMLYLPIFTA